MATEFWNLIRSEGEGITISHADAAKTSLAPPFMGVRWWVAVTSLDRMEYLGWYVFSISSHWLTNRRLTIRISWMLSKYTKHTSQLDSSDNHTRIRVIGFDNAKLWATADRLSINWSKQCLKYWQTVHGSMMMLGTRTKFSASNVASGCSKGPMSLSTEMHHILRVCHFQINRMLSPPFYHYVTSYKLRELRKCYSTRWEKITIEKPDHTTVTGKRLMSTSGDFLQPSHTNCS